jgi:hypothetical protein
MGRGFVTEGMKNTRTYMTDITELCRVPGFIPSRPHWVPHTPLPRESVAPPHLDPRAEHTSLRVRRWEVPIRTTGEKA